MKNISILGLPKRIADLSAIISISLFITACVGETSMDSNQTSNNFSGVSSDLALPSELYTGSRAPALLNKANTLRFVELLFGTSDFDGLANRSNSSEAIPTIDAPIILQIQSIPDLISQENRTPNLARTSVSEYRTCPQGGGLNISGELDDNDAGTLLVELYQCVLEDGVILDGEMSFLDSTASNSGNESYLLSFGGLSATIDGERVIQTGSIQHYEGYSQQWFYKTVINLHSSNSRTGEEYFFENVVDLKGNYSGALSGKIYLSNHGYITLSTSTDFQYNGENTFPLKGTLYLTGNNNTHARVLPQLYQAGGVNPFNTSYTSATDYFLSLDDDGDGLYESNVTQRIGETLLPLQDNQPPIGIITAGTSTVIVPTYNDEYELPEVSRGDTVQLYSANSYDLEGDDFDLRWSIESAPTGSVATLIHTSEGVNNALTLDLPGKYKIGLTTTDINGSGISSLTIIELDASNKAPVIDWWSIDEDPISLPSPDRSINMSFDVVDKDATEDDLYRGFKIETSLQTKPLGSVATWTTDLPYFFTNYKGRVAYSAIRFTPDIVGTYQFKITATDAFGAVSTRVMTKEVW